MKSKIKNFQNKIKENIFVTLGRERFLIQDTKGINHK